MKLRFTLLLLVILAAVLPGSAASADGIIVPQPPICDPCPPPPCLPPHPCPTPRPMAQLAIRYHRVNVTIDDQVAVTHVDQVFYNPNAYEVEGVYLFPVPVGAAISAFTLWMDGEAVQGRVLDAEQARQQYWEIVNSLRDPALLEYLEQGALQARIFPIPPQGERRIELEYSQTLSAGNGLVRYVYPLNTEKFSIYPLEEISVNLDIHSSQPIQVVYSASHAVEIERLSANQVRVEYEASQVTPDKDFSLFYSLGESEALQLLTYRDPGAPADEPGYFLLLLAPAVNEESQPLPKDIVLVLDRSGSMEGEKFRQAQAALRFILEHLNPGDRFNLLAFSTATQPFSQGLSPINAIPQALQWVDSLSAQGSTDINRALLEAAAMFGGERPAYIIFLTDGLPTEGVLDSKQILSNLEQALLEQALLDQALLGQALLEQATSVQANPAQAASAQAALAQAAPKQLRLFSFGVGYDVDTFLLDSLAQAHHGATSYVLPDERIDERVSAFYEKISTPVLMGLQLDFGEIAVFDLYPNPLPDLFNGSQILLTGRYRGGGETTITLSGLKGESVQAYSFPSQVFTQEASADTRVLAALPGLWATRKIGHLLSQVRLNGPDPETIEQIVQLSIRYGVITPYTSYLVTEPAPLGASAQQEIARQQYDQMQSAPAAPVSGQAAVEKAALESSMAQAEVSASSAPSVQITLRNVGSHSFIFKEGKWIDTAYDPDLMQTVDVEFLSEQYVSLVSSNNNLAAVFALGKQVIAVSGDTAYEVFVVGESTAEPFETIQTAPTAAVESPVYPPAATDQAQPGITNGQTPVPTTAPTGGLPICASGWLILALLALMWVLRR